MYHVDRLPPQLSTLRRWVPWRLTRIKGGGLTKKPAVSTKEGPWEGLDDVLDGLPPDADPRTCGPGLVFTGQVEIDGKRLFALDLDGCRDPERGEVQDWALDIVEKFDTYTEVSPSGTGLRVFGLLDGDVPRMRVVKLPGEHYGDHRGREIQLFGYGAASYVTVTGDRLDNGPRGLGVCTLALRWLQQKYPSPAPEIDETPPTPMGREPTVEELDTQIRLFATKPQIELIEQGDFGALDLPSASEGWFVLLRLALQHCAGHIDVAQAWLIERTAYGRGEVEDSKDPARYASERWVRADLLRVHGKAQAERESVFSPVETNGSPALSQQEQTTVYDRVAATEVFTAVGDEEPVTTPDTGNPFFELVDVLMQRDPRPNWLIQGVLEANCLAALSGAPGSLKSFTALDICFAMACGQQWHGRKVRHAPVLYYAGEGHGGLSRRARSWFKHHGIDPSGARLAISKHAAQFLDDKAFGEAAKQAHAMATYWNEAPGLIVIDTLNRNFGPGDENSTEDMTKFIARCDALRRKFPGSTVLIVHHTGWGDSSRGRGSSALKAAMDTDLMMHREAEKKGQKPPLHTRLSWSKMKDAEEPDPLWLLMKPVELGVDEEGEAFGSLVVDRVTNTAPTAAPTSPLADPEVQRDIDVLLAFYREHPSGSIREATEATGVSRRRRADLMTLMETYNLVEVSGHTNSRIYTLTAAAEARLADDLFEGDE